MRSASKFYNRSTSKKLLSASFNKGNMLQRKCTKCEEEENSKLHRKENSSVPFFSARGSGYLHSLDSKGSSLSNSTNQFFKARMGHDFSHVKIHTGKEAEVSAKAIHAKAYTIGDHIVFNKGEYDAESHNGRKLLAHELTHVLQQAGNKIQRQAGDGIHVENEDLGSAQFSGQGMYTQNTTHFANCNGVTVRGRTSANYTNSFSSDGTQQRARRCRGCDAGNCVTSTGTVTSDFSANPSVFLPSPQSGLNDCEHAAVQNFIDTTLAAHEQQHVDAFNTYVGTVTTAYTFTGCLTNLQAHIQAVHDRVERARRASSDAASAALDANGANQFTVTCNCP